MILSMKLEDQEVLLNTSIPLDFFYKNADYFTPDFFKRLTFFFNHPSVAEVEEADGLLILYFAYSFENQGKMDMKDFFNRQTEEMRKLGNMVYRVVFNEEIGKEFYHGFLKATKKQQKNEKVLQPELVFANWEDVYSYFAFFVELPHGLVLTTSIPKLFHLSQNKMVVNSWKNQ